MVRWPKVEGTTAGPAGICPLVVTCRKGGQGKAGMAGGAGVERKNVGRRWTVQNNIQIGYSWGR